MKILLAHSFYQFSGGEEVVFSAEKKMLSDRGHEVIEYTDDNKRIGSENAAAIALDSFWAVDSYKKISALIKKTKPDIAHFHNIFPLISPSAYYACHQAGIPVVQTVHNYRMVCPVATLYRNGKICIDCVGKPFAYPGIIHKCYHDSAAQTVVVAAMNFSHRAAGTWRNKVTAYIALSEFMKKKLITYKIAPEKIHVKPNFVDQIVHPEKNITEDYFLYVGRLAPEKGLPVLLEAWANSSFPLKIVGEGPLEAEVKSLVEKSMGRVEYLGQVARNKVFELMKSARALIVPSTWNEPFGLIIIEAFASGLAVIASDHEPINGIVENNKTGLLYFQNDAQDLTRKTEWAWRHPQEMSVIGQSAYAVYLNKYTADKNYLRLMEIYNLARDKKHHDPA